MTRPRLCLCAVSACLLRGNAENGVRSGADNFFLNEIKAAKDVYRLKVEIAINGIGDTKNFLRKTSWQEGEDYLTLNFSIKTDPAVGWDPYTAIWKLENLENAEPISDKLHLSAEQITWTEETGTAEKFKILSPPEKADSFGEYKILLSIKGTAVFYEGGKEKKIELIDPLKLSDTFRIFYKRTNRDFKVNDRKVANWFYYWSREGSADPGKPENICSFYRNAQDNTGDRIKIIQKVSGPNPYQSANGRFQAEKDYIELYDPSAKHDTQKTCYVILAGKEDEVGLKANFTTRHAVDRCEITYCHEATHLKCWWACEENEKKEVPNPFFDIDDDKVPDSWEKSISLNLIGSPNTFPHAFNPSLSASSGGARDFEFYAWICGCFEFGELKRKEKGKWVDIPSTAYHSLYFVPKKTKRYENDWSVLRVWRRYRGEHWNE